MKGSGGITVFFTAVFISFAGYESALSQTVKQDTSKTAKPKLLAANIVKTDSVKVDSTSGDLILDEIKIEGEIEKPGVILIPKRLEPKLQEKGLNRSFKEELKNNNGEIIKPTKELRKVERVESIRQTLEKKRKKK